MNSFVSDPWIRNFVGVGKQGKHPGRFRLPFRMIYEDFETCEELLSRVFVIEAERNIAGRYIEYVAISDEFEPVSDDEDIHEYEIIHNEEDLYFKRTQLKGVEGGPRSVYEFDLTFKIPVVIDENLKEDQWYLKVPDFKARAQLEKDIIDKVVKSMNLEEQE